MKNLILANNPDVNLTEPSGLTALLLYASHEQGKYVKTVLELKSDINHQDELGHTPLFWARHWGRNDIIKDCTDAKKEQESREASDKGQPLSYHRVACFLSR
jgi:ankyrin repeat protein